MMKLMKEISSLGDVYVVNDGGSAGYEKVKAKAFVYMEKPWGGKAGYYETINTLWGMVKDKEYDYYLFIQDDMMIKKRWLERAIRVFDAIEDKNKICLNLYVGLSRYRKKTWTNFVPYNTKYALKTQWTDMNCFLVKKDFFDVLNWNIPPTEKRSEDDVLSSGVGAYISRQIHYKTDKTIYQSYTSLVVPQKEASISLMNKWRNNSKDEKLFHSVISPVSVAQIASIPCREKNLKDTVKSLRPQVDKIKVMLNGYTKKPSFLKSDECVFLDNSLGDAAKFYGLEEFNGYVFTCDDDLIYPEDYVERSIMKINQYHCPVVWHGRIYPRPYKSYKTVIRYLRFAKGYSEDTYVDVGGTGVMGFHTHHIRPDLSEFKKPNMADVWMAKICKKANVKILAMAHNGEIMDSRSPTTIYQQRSSVLHKDEDEVLKELFNGYSPHISKGDWIYYNRGCGKIFKGQVLVIIPDGYYKIKYKAPGGWRKAVASLAEITKKWPLADH